MPYNSIISRADAAPLMPEIATQIFDGMTRASSLMPLMTQLPNMSRGVERMPVLEALPVAYMRGSSDTALLQTTAAKWKNKFINAVEIDVVCPLPLNVLRDSGVPIWDRIIGKATEAIAACFDGAVAIGNAAAAYPIWPDPIAVQAEKARNAVSLGGAATFTDWNGVTYSNAAFPNIYKAIAGENGAMQKTELDGYNNIGTMGSIGLKGKLRDVSDAAGRPLLLSYNSGAGEGFSYSIAGVPTRFAENGSLPGTTALALGGDFSEAVFSVREDIDFRIATDGVITDNTNAIIYNLTQSRMVALLMWFRVGWQVANPPNLVNSDSEVDANGNSKTRCPFWKLTN